MLGESSERRGRRVAPAARDQRFRSLLVFLRGDRPGARRSRRAIAHAPRTSVAMARRARSARGAGNEASIAEVETLSSRGPGALDLEADEAQPALLDRKSV